MKTGFLYIILAALVLVACESKKVTTQVSEKIVVKGTVIGLDSDLSIYADGKSYTASLDSLGNFSFEIDSLKACFATLSFDRANRQEIYLKPGAEIILNVDYKRLNAKSRSAVRISGNGSKESELLYHLMVNNERFKYTKADYSKYITKLYDREPADFETYIKGQVETEYILIDEFVKMNPEVDANFVKNLKINVLINYNRNFFMYGNSQNRLKTGRNTIPENFVDYFADRIPQNDLKLYDENDTYRSYVRSKYYRIVEEALKDNKRESLEWYKARVAYLERCDFPKTIVQDLFNGLTIGYMRTRDSEIRAYLTGIIAEKVTDKGVLARWETFKARDEGCKDGDMAPGFTHKDINGNLVSLSDFRGNLVYIDLWATWCVPCLKGVPYFDKMRKEYAGKKIVFLAVSLDENVDAWKKKVTENEGGIFNGIQLNTGSYKCDVSKNFVLGGIPQYVLIGADGRIIKKNAPRPHGEEIIELIDTELKKLD